MLPKVKFRLRESPCNVAISACQHFLHTFRPNDEWETHVTGFAPPEDVHDTVQPSERGRGELELGYCQALRSSRDDLDDEPREL